jgi:hypothetical protein
MSAPRFVVYGITQDAEPVAVTYPLAYADTLDEAKRWATEYTETGTSVTIFDRELEDYISTTL